MIKFLPNLGVLFAYFLYQKYGLSIEILSLNDYIEYIHIFIQIKQEEKMEETARILEELFDKGYATREISLIGDKLKANLRSLSGKDQLEIEADMGKDKVQNNPAAYVIHNYGLKLLSKTVTNYGDKEFKSSKEAIEFLKELTSSLLDKLVKAQNALEKDVREALKLENVEANFSGTGPLPEKSEQQPE